MEIRNLRSFVRVAQLSSFSKAAKELGYSQAAITIQIQQLEEELATRLFERFNKTIQLSEEGELFLVHAQEILQAVQSAKTCMKKDKEPQGHLRIGTIESLCTSLFPSIIKEYHTRYPKVTISLEAASPKQLLEHLHQHKLDLIYILDQPIYDANLRSTIFEEEEVVFVCSHLHPLAQKASCSLAELAKEKWILTEEDASYRCALSNYFSQQEINITPALAAGNTDLIISLLQDDFGISFLPKRLVLPYLEDQTLVALQPKDLHFTIYRQLLYHKNKWLTSPMQAFIQLLS